MLWSAPVSLSSFADGKRDPVMGLYLGAVPRRVNGRQKHARAADDVTRSYNQAGTSERCTQS